MKKYFTLLLISLICSPLFSNVLVPSQEQIDYIMEETMSLIWRETMNAKNKVNTFLPDIREDYIENLCSSAPRVDFITHADLSDSLTMYGLEANIYVSTDNQASWFTNNNVAPLDIEGYETTWAATTTIDGGNNIAWYLSGLVNSAALGLDFGNIIVSQSPYNSNNTWVPGDNLYALLAEDEIGDTGSGQDINNVRASYSDNKIYASLGLQANCCDEGGFFGPWNLYVIAIINPEAEEQVAYALGYGDGGFGQLYPALYKIDGDLSTGEVSGFEALDSDFQYSTNGSNLDGSVSLSYLINDSGWGVWPNSLNGIVVLGTTVSAGLDGLDIAVELLDVTAPGLLVMSTQFQDGNNLPTLTNPLYDSNSGLLSVTYTDFDNNLATTHEVFIEDMVFIMIPDSHTYSEGVTFSAYVGDGGTAELVFSDGDGIITLEVDLGGSGSSCQVVGDANGDAEINVLDVVLTVNLILCSDCPDNYNECSDINNDGTINVLDVVSLVNIILGNQ